MTIPPFSGRTTPARCPEMTAVLRAAAALLCACAALLAQSAPKQAPALAAAAAAAARGEPGAAERIAALARAYPHIPDFLAYWRAQALAAAKRYEEAAAALDPVWRTRFPSSLAGRAAALGPTPWCAPEDTRMRWPCWRKPLRSSCPSRRRQ